VSGTHHTSLLRGARVPSDDDAGLDLGGLPWGRAQAQHIAIPGMVCGSLLADPIRQSGARPCADPVVGTTVSKEAPSEMLK
jgi:hypothetical protein